MPAPEHAAGLLEEVLSVRGGAEDRGARAACGAPRVKCLLSSVGALRRTASLLSNTQMPDTVSARRFLLRCALVVACAAALGGCSMLEVERGTEGHEDSGGRQAPQAGPAPDAPSSSGSPSWNLHTLASTQLDAQSGALSLEQAWYLAVRNDPDYQAALSGRAAALTEIRLGRAALLPQVQAGYSRNRISGLQRQYVGTATREGELDYDSTSAYIQLQQPIFNVDRYAQFQRGHARAQLGEAEFAMQEYEAAMRLVSAYIDVLAAQGRSELAHALADSLAEQAKAQDALLERNEASRVDAQETRARLALAQADVIRADDELRVARRQLQALIGQEPPPLASVNTIDPERAQLGDSLTQWLERAQANGPMIRRGTAQVRVADTEVRRAAGRHLPTADLVMAVSDADSENLDSLSQRSNTFTVGLRVAIPIFSGGYDTANHARSRHERQRAEAQLAQAREQTAAEVTRQYTAAQSGAQRIAALLSSIRSGEQSLEAARQGYEYGVNSNLDVLRRQDSLFQARFELLKARVAWLEARIALAAAAGELVAAVFAEMDAVIERGAGNT